MANKIKMDSGLMIPDNTPLVNILLPNEWILYLYDKAVFKKMANRPNFQAKPYKEVCTLRTVNDIIYLLTIMEIRVDPMSSDGRINMDMGDFIIMRKGIEPIWEDPKNSNGGTFTIKMDHSKGYLAWSIFVMMMTGESLNNDMRNINGITISYISDTYNYNNNGGGIKCYSYIKIWDAKPNRTQDQFVQILPPEIMNVIRTESLRYTKNESKKHYGRDDIINKLKKRKPRGFSNNNRY